jgi:hypothetical protein
LKLQANGTKEAPVIIRGVGETRPVFDGEGIDTSGRGPIPRAIFQIEGAHIIIERLEFRNARNNHNAAGIRLLASTNAVIRDCKITQCDMGIFGDDKETALIEKCEVAFNGTEKFNGYSHNFYMHGNRVVVRGCHIHNATFGQNFKSRAHYNELWFNWIADSNQGEVGFVDARGTTDKPHSNALMVGNIVVSKEGRTGNTMKFIDFGSDGGNARIGTLFLFHNTFVAGDRKIKFLMFSSPGVSAVVERNIFSGGGDMIFTLKPPTGIKPGYNTTVFGRGFVNAGQRDFRLQKDNRAWQERDALTYEDGDGTKQTLKLITQYEPHLQIVPRASATRDGAFEATK